MRVPVRHFFGLLGPMERSKWDDWSCATRATSVIFSRNQVGALVDFITHFGSFTDIIALKLIPEERECRVYSAELPVTLAASATFKVQTYSSDSSWYAHSVCVRAGPLTHLLKLTVQNPLLCVFHTDRLALFEANSKNLLWVHGSLPHPSIFSLFQERQLYVGAAFRLQSGLFTALVWPQALAGGFTTCSFQSTPPKFSMRSGAGGGEYVWTATECDPLVHSGSVGPFSRTVGTRQLCLLAALLPESSWCTLYVHGTHELDVESELPYYKLHVRLYESACPQK